MARTIAQIQQSIIDAKMSDGTLSGLTSTSRVAIWRLWTYVVAVCQWTLENMMDLHKAEVITIIRAEKAHTLQWYATKAKAFQYGDALPPDSDVYDPVAEAGDASLIVAYAAAVEVLGQVRVKIAKITAGVLGPLSGGELAAFTDYMQRVKDAGVRLLCTSGVADTFRPTMKIYYDPLVLDGAGARLDGTAATPLKDAIGAFLSSLPFNGVFILNKFIEAMQEVEGVVIAGEVDCSAFYGSITPVLIDGSNPQYIPDAGYLVLDTVWFGTHTTYVAYE